MPDGMTAAEAPGVVADQDQRRALKSIQDAAVQLTRYRQRLGKKKEAFDRMIAFAVSQHPTRPDWYQHPGPLPVQDVCEVAGLSSMQLHRLMDRYRKSRGA